jgi:hypothetical protein
MLSRLAYLRVPESRPQALSCEFVEGGADADDRWMALRLLSDLLSAAGMAGAADAALSDQGRGAAGVATRGRGAPPTGGPDLTWTGRPRGAGRAFADASSPNLAGAVRATGHAAALAPGPGSAPLELPTPAWPSRRGAGDPGSGAAAGQGEPDLEVRRVHGELGRLGYKIGASTVWATLNAAVGPDLAAVPPRPGRGCAGGGPASPWTPCSCNGGTCCS